jgi:hypothetical protein
MCQWTNCSQSFNDEQLLQSHILRDHIPSSSATANDNNSACMWMDCDQNDAFQDTSELTSHIKNSHLLGFTDNSDIQGVALVAAQLLKVLSRNPNSHVCFMPYEQELVSMARRRPKLIPFIETMFSNFRVASTSSTATSTASSPTTT